MSIPGFPDIEVNPSLAIIGVALAALLFGYEYYLEVRLTRFRNNPLFASAGVKSINGAVAAFGANTSALISAMERYAAKSDAEVEKLLGLRPIYNMGELTEYLNELSSKLVGQEPSVLERRYPPETVNAMTYPARQSAELLEADLTEARQRLSLNLAVEISGRESLRNAVRQSGARAEALVGALEQVSNSVLRFQRAGFYSKDYFIPTVFLFGTLGLTAFRLLARFRQALDAADWPAWACAIGGVAIGTLVLCWDQKRIRADARARRGQLEAVAALAPVGRQMPGAEVGL